MTAGVRMPAMFFGHGSPMNTLEDNVHTRAWAAAGRSCPRPKAILAISAHWYIRGTAVTALEKPPTIHDFGGFPPALHAVQYPAAGDPALAQHVRELLAPVAVALDHEWGLDHGTWSVLAHVYPGADVPVVQLAIDGTQPPQFHYDLGRRLRALRDEGILLFASGNVVHNLRVIRWGADAQPFAWASEFNEKARALIERREHAPLIDYAAMGDAARMSIPTPDHYLPLLYILGAHRDDDEVRFITDGIELGSISMLSFAAGPPDA
ncbi:MAG: 4,5-DOPA dioxygenase extradiol [Burkholderiales bacterium]